MRGPRFGGLCSPVDSPLVATGKRSRKAASLFSGVVQRLNSTNGEGGLDVCRGGS
jgi:hypothetical protein